MAFGAASLQPPQVRIPTRAWGDNVSLGAQAAGLLASNKGPGATGNDTSYVAHAAAVPQVAGLGTRGNTPPVPARGGGGSGAGHSPRSAPPKPTTGPYGLDTTSTAPYNPFKPITQGQFNKDVAANVKSQVQPEYNAIAGNVAGENSAAQARGQGITGIFSTYGQQAQSAFDQAKAFLTNLITSNSQGDEQAKNYLQAALGSANAPTSQFDQMLGLSPQVGTAGEAIPYNLAASGLANAGENELNQEAAGGITNAATQLSNAGLEEAQAKNTEGLRHQSALEGYAGQRQAIANTIPSLVTNAQTSLGKQLQDAATSALQGRIAKQTLALDENKTGFSEQMALKTFDQNVKQQGTQNKLDFKKLGLEGKSLDLQTQKLNTSISEFNAKTVEKTAQLDAKRSQNVATFVQDYLAPTPEEIQKSTSTSLPGPNGTTKTSKTTINWQAYRQRINPLQLTQSLQYQYGLSQKQALQSLLGINVQFGTGGQTVGQWAQQQLLDGGYVQGERRVNAGGKTALPKSGSFQVRPGDSTTPMGPSTKPANPVKTLAPTTRAPTPPPHGTGVTSGAGGKLVPSLPRKKK